MNDLRQSDAPAFCISSPCEEMAESLVDHVREIYMVSAVVPDARRDRGQALFLFPGAVHRSGESGYDGAPGGHTVQEDDERTQVAVFCIRAFVPRLGSAGSAYNGNF